MPKIIENKKQKDALKKTKALLEKAKAVNALLEADIAITAGEGKAAVRLFVDGKDADKIKAVLISIREKAAKEARSTCKENDICLLEEDEAVLSGRKETEREAE